MAPRFNYLPNSFTEYKLPGEERRRKRGVSQEPGDLLDRYAMYIAMQLRINPEVEKAMFFYSASETNMEYSILGVRGSLGVNYTVYILHSLTKYFPLASNMV